MDVGWPGNSKNREARATVSSELPQERDFTVIKGISGWSTSAHVFIFCKFASSKGQTCRNNLIPALVRSGLTAYLRKVRYN